MLWGCLTCSAQSVTDVLLMKDPISRKWGYANKVQNRKSPFRGAKKFGRVILGKNMGAALIDKSEARYMSFYIFMVNYWEHWQHIPSPQRNHASM